MRTTAVVLFSLTSLGSLAATRSVLLPVQVNYPVGAALFGGELYVANLREATAGGSVDAVYVLDPTSGAMRRTLTQGRVLQHVDSDGTSLWAVKLYGTYERLSPAGFALESLRLPNGVRSIGFAFDRRAGVMFELGGMASTELRLRDRTGALLRVVATVKSHESWSGLAFDGCTLWTSDLATDELVRLDPATGAELERRPTPDGALGQVEGLGFDGTTLIVTDQKRNKVHFIDIAPSACAPTAVPDAGTPPPTPADAGWSLPDAGSSSGGEVLDGGAGGGSGGSGERSEPSAAPFGSIDAEPQGCGCGGGDAAPQLLLLLWVALARRRRE